MAEKKLMYRKTMLKQIYRLSELFDETLKYDTYKDVILYDLKSDYKYVNYLKGIFNFYLYLLEGKSKQFELSDLEVLYKLVFNKKLSKKNLNGLLEIKSNDNILLKKLLLSIKEGTKIETFICSYVMIAYWDYLINQKIFNYSPKFFRKLFEMINKSFDYESIITLIEEEKRTMLPCDEKYYDNLKDLSKKDIVDYLLKAKDEIKLKYKIGSLYLFGSFSKNKQRIDSDIDLIGCFSEYLNYSDKQYYVNEFKKYIKEIFSRRCDFGEYYHGVFKEEYYEKLY